MRQIIFATHNLNKIEEIRQVISKKIEIISLSSLGDDQDIPETGQTLNENAYQKAKYVYDKYHKDCFADDTGLEVEVLYGRPGVYSARFAGENCTSEDNMIKLLEEMGDTTNRNAKFRTVICLIENGKARFFEGECNGIITTQKYGNKGFGYDPIFIPNGFGNSFAEMSKEEKNLISHRGIATRRLIAYLLNEDSTEK